MSLYDAVMKMEELLNVYEKLIEDLETYMKENGINDTGDNSGHPAVMMDKEARRVYSHLLSTKRIEDLLRFEGEYKLMSAMVGEMKAGAWENISKTNKYDKAI